MDPLTIALLLKVIALAGSRTTELNVFLLTYDEIIDWFTDHRALMESEKGTFAFTLQQKLAADHYKTIQGFFNEPTHRIVTARSIVSQRVDSKVAAIHTTEELAIYG